MAYPASTVFEKYSDLEGLGELLKNVPMPDVPTIFWLLSTACRLPRSLMPAMPNS